MQVKWPYTSLHTSCYKIWSLRWRIILFKWPKTNTGLLHSLAAAMLANCCKYRGRKNRCRKSNVEIKFLFSSTYILLEMLRHDTNRSSRPVFFGRFQRLCSWMLLNTKQKEFRSLFFFFFTWQTCTLSICSTNSQPAGLARLFKSLRGEKFTIGSGQWCFPEFNLGLTQLPRIVW